MGTPVSGLWRRAPSSAIFDETKSAGGRMRYVMIFVARAARHHERGLLFMQSSSVWGQSSVRS
jgi:hypothetical protein